MPGMFSRRALPLLRQALLCQGRQPSRLRSTPAIKPSGQQPIRVNHGPVRVDLQTVPRTARDIAVEACTLAGVRLAALLGVTAAGGLLVWWATQEAIDGARSRQPLDVCDAENPTKHIQELKRLLCATMDEYTTRPVLLVTGMPGAGKSHTVMHAVHDMPDDVAVFYVDVESKSRLVDNVRTGCGINQSCMREWIEGNDATVDKLRRYLQHVEKYARQTGKRCIFIVDNFDQLVVDNGHNDANDPARVLADTMSRWTKTDLITSVVISYKGQASRYFRSGRLTEFPVNNISRQEACAYLEYHMRHLCGNVGAVDTIISNVGLRMGDLSGFVHLCQRSGILQDSDGNAEVIVQESIVRYTKFKRRLFGMYLQHVLRSSDDDDRRNMICALNTFVANKSVQTVGELATFHGLYLLNEQQIVYPCWYETLAYQLPAPYMVQEVADVLKCW